MSIDARSQLLACGVHITAQRLAVMRAVSGRPHCTADDVAEIIGFAAHAASGTTAREAAVYPALPNMVFEGTLEDESNTAHALAQTDLFGKYALQKTAGGIWYLDENDTTNVAARIIAFRHSVGDIRARVFFTLLNSVTIFA